MFFLIASCCWAFASAAPPVIDRVVLERGFYLVSRPDGVPASAETPLVFALHGTDTRAIDIIKFWRGLEFALPCTLIAPQASDRGWRDGDLRFLADVLVDVRANVPHDGERVLLTGHSAGGAMAFHLLYAERFPATALAVTACYVAPTVAPEDVAARRDVAVFYAVGERDVNRLAMRRGLRLLHENGVRVTNYTPEIGHVLSREVTQAGLTWFEEWCRSNAARDIKRARKVLESGGPLGEPLAKLEDLLRREASHFADQVVEARWLVESLQAAGKRSLRAVEADSGKGRYLVARQALLEVEVRYAGSSLAVEARRRRTAIERRPELENVLRLERLVRERKSQLGETDR